VPGSPRLAGHIPALSSAMSVIFGSAIVAIGIKITGDHNSVHCAEIKVSINPNLRSEVILW